MTKFKEEYDKYSPLKIFDPIHSPTELSDKIQTETDRIIKDCSNVDWSEDYLSYQIIRSIRDILSGYIIPNIDNNLDMPKFDLEAYKLTGRAEQNHGDIAIVVTRSFPYRKQPISGVGFYEAKASSIDGYDYPSFSIQQLRRLVTHTPKLTYLLYNKNPQISNTQEWPIFDEPNHQEFYADNKRFNANTVDANFLKQNKSIQEAAMLIGQSFGYHFVQKILSGRELDYSRPPIETIRHWLKNTKRTNALVISIAVQDDNKYPINAQLTLPGFAGLQLPQLTNNHIYQLTKD